MIDVTKLQQISEFNESNYQRVMLEATYYGKNDLLKETEKILDQMVEIGHNMKKTTMSEEFNDLMYQVAENLRKAFGFYSLSINASIFMLHPKILYNYSTTAACTLCHAAIIKYTKRATGSMKTWQIDFDKTHKGIQFTSDSRYIMRMFLSPSLFNSYGEYSLTGAEILAIILHEIGHNFYIGPIRELSSDFLAVLTTVDIIDFVSGTLRWCLITEGSAEIDALMPPKLRNFLNRIYSIIGSIVSPVDSMYKISRIALRMCSISVIMAGLLYKIIMSPITIIRVFMDYDSEKYSDSFAAAYGYAAELNSALYKISRINVPVLSDIKPINEVLDFLYGTYSIFMGVFMYFLDCHPSANARLDNNIKYMQAAGKEITDPKLRKEYDQAMKNLMAVKAQVVEYRGLNPLKLNYKVKMLLGDLTKIHDIKDLTSSLDPLTTRYANLDYAD